MSRRLDKRVVRGIGTVVVALVAVLVWWFQADGDKSADQTDHRVPGTETNQTSEPDQSSEPGARTGKDSESGLTWVSVAELPDEAEETLELIDAGGPFPHERDGVVFGNYEGILPAQQRGHYREYTVPTPGLSHRGARRIVTGGDDEYFWTADHYTSFERIDWPEGGSG